MTSTELKEAKDFFLNIVSNLPEPKTYPLKKNSKKIIIKDIPKP